MTLEIVETKDGFLTARHGEIPQEFHSKDGARLEAEHLYVRSSGFVDQIAQRNNTVLDIGMGLGYNALVTLEFWTQDSNAKDLTLVSLEKDTSLISALVRLEGAWQKNWPKAWVNIIEAYSKKSFIQHPITHAQARWEILEVDAALNWCPQMTFDYFWQDPFSLPFNAELWDVAWFAKLKSCCNPGAVLVTYSVARGVKDALTNAGWSWELIPTVTAKRHWLRAKIDIK